MLLVFSLRSAALRRAVLGAALLAAASAGAARAAPAQGGTWALTNARIETVTRGVIERGTIVIRDGLIAAVGANVTPPPDARVVDMGARTVYPGFIDLTSTLGLPAAAAPAGGFGGGRGAAAPDAPAGTPIGLEPERSVAREIRPAAADIRATRDAGVTAALVAPARGALRGVSALVPLRDTGLAERVLRSPVALHMGFQAVAGRYPGTLLGVIAYERQALYDAQRHGALLDRYRTNPRGMERPEFDPALDALVPVVRGTLPAFFEANNENEIRRAVRIGKEFDLTLTVVGATEGFRALDALKGARPVVVSVNFPRAPDVTGWSYRSTQRHPLTDSARVDSAVRKLVEGNAAALHRAGVRFALASGGARGEFLANVRKAVAAGLPRETAVEALTIRPAEIAGVADVMGSIEVGKIANLVVADANLLSDSGRVREVFVDGERYEVASPARAGRGGGGRTVAGAGGAGGGGAPVGIAGSWTVV
ncbi:MAG: amidohydrolase family protein, partial [Gemmatimonadaceae bacterium]